MDEFWMNLRNAASQFIPSKVTTDLAQGDVDYEERVPPGGVKWLASRSVEGFDVNDFKFLEETQQAALKASVERFLAVANRVPRKQAATPSQAEEGRAAIGDIMRILKPHSFHDAESFKTQVLLVRELQGRLPRWVTAISCRTDTDHTGDPCIRIQVDVTDAATRRGLVKKKGLEIREEVKEAYHLIGGRLWPFIRFRSPDALDRKWEARHESRG